MSGKQTSLASTVARQEAAARKKDEKEDEQIAARAAPAGKTWVRLIRPHYDAEGTYHEVGPALLDSDAIPSSAKVLSRADAKTAEADE